MTNYTHPPGRPQSMPPGLNGPAPKPKGVITRLTKRDADPHYAATLRQNQSEGQRAAYQKAVVQLERECLELNRAETRGRWYTLTTMERDLGKPYEQARSFIAAKKIDEHRIGRTGRFLIPFDALPATVVLNQPSPPFEQPAPPPAVLPLPGEEVVVRRRTITTDQLEEYLVQMHGFKSPRFNWTSTGVTITFEEPA